MAGSNAEWMRNGFCQSVSAARLVPSEPRGSHPCGDEQTLPAGLAAVVEIEDMVEADAPGGRRVRAKHEL